MEQFRRMNVLAVLVRGPGLRRSSMATVVPPMPAMSPPPHHVSAVHVLVHLHRRTAI